MLMSFIIIIIMCVCVGCPRPRRSLRGAERGLAGGQGRPLGLSSNDNGCEGVMKHRSDAPQASISLVLQRLAEACCVGGGAEM